MPECPGRALVGILLWVSVSVAFPKEGSVSQQSLYSAPNRRGSPAGPSGSRGNPLAHMLMAALWSLQILRPPPPH